MRRLRTRFRVSSALATQPTLSLNFLSGTTLDSRVTFTRGTNATLTDGTGRVTYAPANLLVRSEEFDNVAWTKGAGVTVAANAGVAPDGTATADNVTFTSGGGAEFLRQSLTMVVGVTYIVSVFARLISGSPTFTFDAGNNPASSAQTPTSSWQRFSFAFTFSGSNQWIDIQASAAGTIAFWGAQLEPVTYQTTPGTYVATTSAAYFGPRFDYDPVTLAPRGLLIEEARTNLLTFSEQFDNAAWTKSGGAITANSTTAPDGTSTADTFTESSATTFRTVQASNISFTAGLTYAISVFAKQGAGTRVLQLFPSFAQGGNGGAAFNLMNGTVVTTAGTGSGVGSITSVGNGWFRCTFTFVCQASGTNSVFIGMAPTTASAFTVSYAGDGTSGVFLWGAQLEAGAFATSYIPTVASTVTRNADVATMSGTNFSSWFNSAEGAFIFSGDSAYGAGGFIGSTPTTGAILYANSNASRTFNGTNFIGTANTYTNNVVFGTALGYSSAGRAIVLNGGTVATDANLIQTPTAITLGGAFGGGFLNGHIRQIAYYNTRLPNAQLQALTT